MMVSSFQVHTAMHSFDMGSAAQTQDFMLTWQVPHQPSDLNNTIAVLTVCPQTFLVGLMALIESGLAS